MQIDQAITYIKKGGLVAFPTETVYGLGADATNDEACRKIYAYKNRPLNNPLIIHVASLEKALEIANFNKQALNLAQKFWPGPLSLVLPIKNLSKISTIVTAGLNTVAIRIPNNKIALEFLKKIDKPIAAPSANLSGYVSSTTSHHVKVDFANIADIYIIESENCIFGIESTILDCTKQSVKILRQGFITDSDLQLAMNQLFKFSNLEPILKAPGMMNKHYSPNTKLRLNAQALNANELGLGFGNVRFTNGLNLSLSGDLVEAAHNLYAMLRLLDSEAIQKSYMNIAVAPIPEDNLGVAINDKLRRAAY